MRTTPIHGRPATMLAQFRSPETRDSVTRGLASLGSLAVHAYLGGIETLEPAELTRNPPDVLFVDLDLGSPAQVATLEALAGAGASVVVTAERPSVESLRRLLRLGIADLVPQPVEPGQALDAVRSAIAQALRRRGGPETGRGAVIAFLKAGGGVGATSLAVQAACQLAAAGAREKAATKADASVCLLDFDLQFGAAALHLDIDHSASLIELPDLSRRFDSTLLRSAVAHHAGGVDLLPAPASVHPLDMVTPETACALVQVAAQEYRHTLIDLPQAWTGWTRAVLAETGAIVLVLRPDVPSIRQARRQLETLAAEGCGDIPLMAVANRCAFGPFGGGVTLKEAARALGRPIGHAIPRADGAFGEAADAGVPLAGVRGGRGPAKRIGRMIGEAVGLARSGASTPCPDLGESPTPLAV